jgi:hypothetical protein
VKAFKPCGDVTPNYGGQPSPDGNKCDFRPFWLLSWHASRSSGVSRAKAEFVNCGRYNKDVRRRSD